MATNPSTAGAAATIEERTGATGDIVEGVEIERELSERVGGWMIYTEKTGSLITSLIPEVIDLLLRFIGTTASQYDIVVLHRRMCQCLGLLIGKDWGRSCGNKCKEGCSCL